MVSAREELHGAVVVASDGQHDQLAVDKALHVYSLDFTRIMQKTENQLAFAVIVIVIHYMSYVMQNCKM